MNDFWHETASAFPNSFHYVLKLAPEAHSLLKKDFKRLAYYYVL